MSFALLAAAWAVVIGIIFGMGSTTGQHAFDELDRIMAKNRDAASIFSPAASTKTKAVPQVQPVPEVQPTPTAKAVSTPVYYQIHQPRSRAVQTAGTPASQPTPATTPSKNDPAQVKPPDKPAVASPPRTAEKNYALQVAWVRTAEQAEQAVKKLSTDGFTAYHYEFNLNGHNYFRVRVGPFATMEQARQTQSQLATKGYRDVYVSTLTN